MAPAGSDTENEQGKSTGKQWLKPQYEIVTHNSDGVAAARLKLSHFFRLTAAMSSDTKTIRRTSRLPVLPNGVGEGRARNDSIESNPKE